MRARVRVLVEGVVRAAHARGLHVHDWIVDNPRVAAHFVELGDDGLMTDRRDLIRS